ncbi:MAG: hypothetical protein ACLQBK_00030 [Candidatus Sulfotelmatobacter sp.]
MNECEQVEPPLQLKINDMQAKSVRLRFHPGAPGDREVVVEDPWLGVFAIDHSFDLLLKEKDSEWRAVTLDELRSILAANKDFQDTGEQANNHQALEFAPRGGPNELAGTRPKLVRLGTVIGLDACVQRVATLLYKASIPHIRAGSTFVVPFMMNARECLLGGGFCQDQRYEPVLVDPNSGIAVRLLERDPSAISG